MTGATVQIGRTCLVVTCLAIAGALCVTAQNLLLRSSGTSLRISAPGLHFLEGKPLDRLKNGLSVPFDIKVSVLTESKSGVLWSDIERFTLSYDLWEERFSVKRLRSEDSSASHLTAPQAEAWCFDRFAIPHASLPIDRRLHFRVDVYAREPKETRGSDPEEPLSLGALIDLLSRPARPQHLAHYRAESGPVRIADLLKTQAQP